MNVTDITSDSFNGDVIAAKQAAASGPVFVNEGNSRTHVLLSDAQFQFFMRMAFITVSPEVKLNLEYKYRVTEF